MYICKPHWEGSLKKKPFLGLHRCPLQYQTNNHSLFKILAIYKYMYECMPYLKLTKGATAYVTYMYVHTSQMYCTVCAFTQNTEFEG